MLGLITKWTDRLIVRILHLFLVSKVSKTVTAIIIMVGFCRQGSLTVNFDNTKKSKQTNVASAKTTLPPGNLQLNRRRKMDFKKVKKQRRRAGIVSELSYHPLFVLLFLHFDRVATNLEYSLLRDFSEHGKLREFCATSGKNCNKQSILVHHSNICV